MLLGFAFSRLLPRAGRRKSAWITAGAAAPDLPLIVVAFLCWVVSGFPLPATQNVGSFVRLVDRFYFESQSFIAVHQLLHAPGSLLLLALFGVVVARVTGRWFAAWFWFLTGAATHAAVDLFTHAGDGVLLFWPFDWSYRFNAGIDQWDMQGAGMVVLSVEIGLFLLIGAFVACRRLSPFYSFLTMPLEGPPARRSPA